MDDYDNDYDSDCGLCLNWFGHYFMKDEDKRYMMLALSLARRAWGRTSPNPMVGAVIVKNENIIGRGYHKCAGDYHAEINAISEAGDSCAGATLYVTLEPCSTIGRTSPCTETIIASGISEVVIGCIDSNPSHSGNGVRILGEAGISVRTGVEQERCYELNEAFFHWIITGRPFVLLKIAMTLDGKIATVAGESQWITGPAARRRVQRLRQWADAIMIGGNTARKDHPSLTVSGIPGWKQPRRIVASYKMTETELMDLLPPGNKPELIKASGKEQWLSELKRLGDESITALLVEGGGELAASLLNAGVVNKVEFHIAPKILGGRTSVPAVGGINPDFLGKALELSSLKCRNLQGGDIIISGYPRI